MRKAKNFVATLIMLINSIFGSTGLGMFFFHPPNLELEALASQQEQVRNWPTYESYQLPLEMSWFRSVYKLIPNLEISDEGWLIDVDSGERVRKLDFDLEDGALNKEVGGVPISWVVLLQNDVDTLPDCVERYVNTSHFLVDYEGIIQTKSPAQDGTPQIARWVRYSNKETRNSFASAMLDLSLTKGYKGNFNPILIRTFFEEPNVSTFRRALVIKIRETDSYTYNKHRVANLLGLLRALKRYELGAWDIVGNIELYGGVRGIEYDLGVDFVAELRHYLGVMALLSEDPTTKDFVFGDFQNPGETEMAAVIKYFEVNREYLKKVYMPDEIQKWDAKTKYWFLMDMLTGETMPIANGFVLPIDNDSGGGYRYLSDVYSLFNPSEHTGYHTGYDFNIGFGNDDEGEPFKSIAAGVVVWCGRTTNGMGQTIIIKHRLPDGSQVYSRYGHNKDMFVQAGDIVEAGQVIGTIGRTGYEYHPDFYAHLHLDTAYAATYENYIEDNPQFYENQCELRVSKMFVSPLEFIEEHKTMEQRCPCCGPFPY